MRNLIPLVWWFALVGCGGSVVKDDAGNNDHDDAAVYDGGSTIDANETPPPDASVDANTAIDAQPAGPNNREVVPASGKVSGGGYTVEFELGHWVSQKKTTGGTTTTEGAAAVKP